MSSQSAARVDQKLPLAVGVAAAVALLPSLYEVFGHKWRYAPHYSFTPLFLLALGYFAVRRWLDADRVRPDFSVASAVRWALPVALLAASIWLRRPWLASIALVFALRAFAFTIGGKPFYKSVRLIWWASWLCVPLPFNLDVSMITSMQQLASQQASSILDLFGYRHVLTGVLLNFPERAFEVEEACSGVHSLFASIAGVAVYCVAMQRSLGRTVAMLLSAVFWVLVLNIARIVLVVVGEMSWNLPLGVGLVHELAGYIIFALVVLAVISTDRFFAFLIPERNKFVQEKKEPNDDAIRLPGLTKRVSPMWFTNVAVGVFAVLLLFGFVRPSAAKPPLRVQTQRLALSANSLPPSLGDWYRTGFEVIDREPGTKEAERFGEQSYAWKYERRGLQSTIAVDGPFGDWHDLGHCYTGVGWKLSSARDHEMPLVADDKFVATAMRMENAAGESGHVVFAAFQADGKNVDPPAVRVGATGGARLQEGILGMLRPRDSDVTGPVFMVQALSVGPLGLSASERDAHRLLLRRALVAFGDLQLADQNTSNGGE